MSALKGVIKFGRNPDIDTGSTPEDVWDAGGIWVPPTQARVHDVASSSVDDTAAGTGMRTLRLYGLLDWDTEEVEEDITLNGTSNVATANSYVIVYRMEGLTFGSGGTNAGNITATAQTDGTVTAQITQNQGQTLMAIYGVPSVQYLLAQYWYCSMNRTGGTAASADISAFVNLRADQADSGFVVKDHMGLSIPGASTETRWYGTGRAPERPTGFAIYGPALIKIQIENVSRNNTDISSGFGGVLINL